MAIREDYDLICGKMQRLIKAKEKRIILYPYGHWGGIAENVLKDQFEILPEYIIDDNLADSSCRINKSDFLGTLNQDDYMLVLTAKNKKIIESIRHTALTYFRKDRVYDLFALEQASDGKVTWLRKYSEIVYENKMKGSVAECGVYKGEFAKYINEFFPDRACYLFDSFEGFKESDLNYDKELYKKSNFFDVVYRYSKTSIDLVMSKMHNKENVIIKKGFVPETFDGINDDFCFVNLDMDVYYPTLEALRFFYPRMVKNGIILLHDYYTGEFLPGVEKAVRDYEKETGMRLLKIPDGGSVSLIVIKV